MEPPVRSNVSNGLFWSFCNAAFFRKNFCQRSGACISSFGSIFNGYNNNKKKQLTVVVWLLSRLALNSPDGQKKREKAIVTRYGAHAVCAVPVGVFVCVL